MNTQINNEHNYQKMSVVELRKTIADLTKEVLELKSDKKDYVKSINETIKDIDSKIKSAAAALQLAEQSKIDEHHEEMVKDFLAGK